MSPPPGAGKLPPLTKTLVKRLQRAAKALQTAPRQGPRESVTLPGVVAGSLANLLWQAAGRLEDTEHAAWLDDDADDGSEP
jgi:hypothetical protein